MSPVSSEEERNSCELCVSWKHGHKPYHRPAEHRHYRAAERDCGEHGQTKVVLSTEEKGERGGGEAERLWRAHPEVTTDNGRMGEGCKEYNEIDVATVSGEEGEGRVVRPKQEKLVLMEEEGVCVCGGGGEHPAG